MRIVPVTQNGVPIGVRALICTSFLERSRGLLFRASLPRDQVLVLEPCSAIHMIGMRFAIDAVFVDASGTVIKVVSELKPWRFAAAPGARATWEFAAGRAAELNIQIGRRLAVAP
jgi:uncharacterized membrane protein (UPF0127 family)